MLKEAKVASELDHPNITHNFGLFAERENLADELADFYLVSEYVNSGDARSFLARPEYRTHEIAEKLVREVTHSDRYCLLMLMMGDVQFCDLMNGLTFMHSEYKDEHSEKVMICHGDLKGVRPVLYFR